MSSDLEMSASSEGENVKENPSLAVSAPSLPPADLPAATSAVTAPANAVMSPEKSVTQMLATNSNTPPQSNNAIKNPSLFIPRPHVPISTKAPVHKTALNKFQTQAQTVEQLRQRIESDPEDGDAWLALIADSESKGDLESTREIYESFFKIFPDNAKQWVQYADLELRHSLFPKVEAIFARCLRTSTSVELWSFYMTYIRRVNRTEGVDSEKLKQARNIITKAYEFTLLHIGNDRDAGLMWTEYIDFLKAAETSGTWEQQQNMDSLRKVYQRAVVIPLENVEQIWSDYNHWEQNLNKLTAKKFVGEKGAGYMTARAAVREMRTLIEGLLQSPFPKRPQWADKGDRQLIDQWRKYLKWEEGNPLQLEDQAALHTRVLFAYQKAISELRFYPEIWYSASAYASSANKADDAFRFLESGHAANSTSILLALCLAENHEGRKDFEECHKIYNAMTDKFNEILEGLVTKRDTEINEAVAEAQASLQNTSKTEDAALNDGEEENGSKTIGEEIIGIKETIAKRAQAEIDIMRKSAATIYISHMRFARRAETMKSARAIFGKARKSPHITWQVIEANAMMEYHCNKDARVATNVFELGMKSFGEEVDYVVRYLDFLIHINDDTNARAVFERAVSKIPSEQARPLWERFARYECCYSDLAAIQKLDGRIAETYPSVPSLFRFAERHTSSGLTEILTQDLGLLPASSGRPSSIRSRSPSRSLSPPLRSTGLTGSAVNKRSPSPADRYRELPPVSKRLRRDSPSPMPALQNRARQHPRGRPPLSPPPHGRRDSPQGFGGRRREEDRLFDEIPEAVVFFMSILPSSSTFNGPVLPGNLVCDLLSTVSLPPPRGRRRSPSPIRGMPQRRY